MTRPPPTSSLFPYTTLFRSLRLALLTDNDEYRRFAVSTLRLLADQIRRYPSGFGLALCAVDFYLSSPTDRKSTRLNSSHLGISYAVFCLKKKTYTAMTHSSR